MQSYIYIYIYIKGKIYICISNNLYLILNPYCIAIKRDYFQAVAVSLLLYGFTSWTLTKCIEKKLVGNYPKMLEAILNKSGSSSTIPNSKREVTYPHLKIHLSKMSKTTLDTVGEVSTKSSVMFIYGPYTWTFHCWMTSKNLFTSALCGHWMQFGRLTRSNEW